MSLTEDFDDGPGLPVDWSVDSPLGGETVIVVDSCARITLPSGTPYDSIHPSGENDDSAGIVHALPDHSGAVDVAIQYNTDVSNTRGLGLTVLVKGSTDDDAARCSFYASTSSTNLDPLIYGYQRSGGSDGSSGNTSFSNSNTYAHPWMRITYDPDTGLWEYYSSRDGAFWEPLQARVQAFTPTRIKIGITSTNPNPGGTVAIDRVVDVIEAGTTDLRDPVPTATQSTLFHLDGSSGALPPDLTDTSENGGSITWTASAMRLTQDMDTDGSRAGVAYTGPKVTQGGVVALVEHLAAGTLAYLALGLSDESGNPQDQYSAGAGYISETNGGTMRRALRVDPFDNSPNGKLGFEAPYGWLYSGTDTSVVGTRTWIRVERIGRRIRVKDWPDGQQEPEIWRIDAQDQVQENPFALALAYAHNDGSPQSGTRSLDVFSLEFYEFALNVGDVQAFQLQSGVEVPVDLFQLQSGTEVPITIEVA